MKKKQLLKKGSLGFALVLGSLMILFGSNLDASAASYKTPAVIYWATGDVGSMPYAFSAAVAEQIASGMGSKFRLIPGADLDRITMLRAGKAHIAFLAADLYWGTMGLAQYSALPLGPQPLRVIWSGWAESAASTGLANAVSGIRTPYDLKGKRVAWVVGSAWSTEGVRADLAFGNLTLNDVTVIEVSTSGAAYKALVEGKVDYTRGTNTAPGVYEAEASSYGFYMLRYPHDDKEAWARYQQFMPYQAPSYTTIGGGVKKGEKIPTPNHSWPSIATLSDQSDELVYAICKAIYSKMNQVVEAFPVNEALRPERIRPEATLMAPMHPGAIKFFKEIGIWTQAHETANKKRLAHLEKINARWQSYIDEADERMAKTKKKVDSSKEWPEIVRKEIGMRP